jgi:hypothetical protein
LDGRWERGDLLGHECDELAFFAFVNSRNGGMSEHDVITP